MESLGVTLDFYMPAWLVAYQSTHIKFEQCIICTIFLSILCLLKDFESVSSTNCTPAYCRISSLSGPSKSFYVWWHRSHRRSIMWVLYTTHRRRADDLTKLIFRMRHHRCRARTAAIMWISETQCNVNESNLESSLSCYNGTNASMGRRLLKKHGEQTNKINLNFVPSIEIDDVSSKFNLINIFPHQGFERERAVFNWNSDFLNFYDTKHFDDDESWNLLDSLDDGICDAYKRKFNKTLDDCHEWHYEANGRTSKGRQKSGDEI